MGCDIHMYSERFVNGRWVCDQEESVEDEQWLEPFYSDRNYELFGVLAGVRAPSDAHIYPLRGVPEDTSEKVARSWELWDGDGHSHSWLTLEELEQLKARAFLFTPTTLGLTTRCLTFALGFPLWKANRNALCFGSITRSSSCSLTYP